MALSAGQQVRRKDSAPALAEAATICLGAKKSMQNDDRPLAGVQSGCWRLMQRVGKTKGACLEDRGPRQDTA